MKIARVYDDPCHSCVMHANGEEATIRHAIRRAAADLERAGVAAPRLTAELLMAHAHGWDRIRVLSRILDPLAPGVRKRFARLVRRSMRGEPLQYLTGEREFYGLRFQVSRAVLIPRPETEILVEKTISLARKRPGPVHFADVGTGSGCIAISIAHELPNAWGLATDVSLAALAVARANARRLGVGRRLAFLCGDLLACLRARNSFDFILSNPPYIPGPQIAGLPPMVREHEPRQALFGGESGLEAYRRLIPQAAGCLADRGYLLLEVGAGQAPDVAGIASGENLEIVETVADLQGIPRCLVAQRVGG